VASLIDIFLLLAGGSLYKTLQRLQARQARLEKLLSQKCASRANGATLAARAETVDQTGALRTLGQALEAALSVRDFESNGDAARARRAPPTERSGWFVDAYNGGVAR